MEKERRRDVRYTDQIEINKVKRDKHIDANNAELAAIAAEFDQLDGDNTRFFFKGSPKLLLLLKAVCHKVTVGKIPIENVFKAVEDCKTNGTG